MRAMLSAILPLAPAALLLLALAGAATAAEYLGARRCGTCHEAQYRHWEGTAHARAAERLVGMERRDPRCTGCHSTAAGQGLDGVQCESCHGPGGDYWPDFIMADRRLAQALGLEDGASAAICQRCHTHDSPSLVPFDHATALEQVRHRAPEAPR